MKKLILTIGLGLMGVLAYGQNNQIQQFEQFKGKKAIYVPEDKVTYIMDNINQGVNSNGEEFFMFEGLTATVKGNAVGIIALVNGEDPNDIIIRSRRVRIKIVDPITGQAIGITCGGSGTLCVIL